MKDIITSLKELDPTVAIVFIICVFAYLLLKLFIKYISKNAHKNDNGSKTDNSNNTEGDNSPIIITKIFKS